MSTFGACVTSKCGAGPFLTVLIIIYGKQQMTDLFLLSERYPAHQSVEIWGPNKIHLLDVHFSWTGASLKPKHLHFSFILIEGTYRMLPVVEKLAIVDKTLIPSILFSKSSLQWLAVGIIFALEILKEMHFVATKPLKLPHVQYTVPYLFIIHSVSHS